MTREEAIKLLEHISIAYTPTDAYGDYDDPEPYEEAIDMAIEALKGGDAMRNDRTYPTEPYMQQCPDNGADLFSLAEAIKELQKRVEMIGYDDNDEMIYGIDADCAMSAIEDLPSAEQVTSKLKNPCDSLLTDDSDGDKESKSKLDLISRAEAIEALSRSSVYVWSTEQDLTAHSWAISILQSLPSADRPHGEWKWRNGGECSECGFHNSNFDYNYCPNCGADMKGGAE